MTNIFSLVYTNKMTQVDKSQLLAHLHELLNAKLKLLVTSAFEAKEASTNEESKAENKYDTRGLEASYLASGQAQRAQELQEQIYQLRQVKVRNFRSEDKISISSLVELLVDEKTIRYVLLVPIGGVELEFAGLKIQTLTIDAALGVHIFERKVGDEFELNNKFYEIVGLQ